MVHRLLPRHQDQSSVSAAGHRGHPQSAAAEKGRNSNIPLRSATGLREINTGNRINRGVRGIINHHAFSLECSQKD